MSASAIAALVKAGIAALNDPKSRKIIGGILIAILSPLILLVALLCCLGSGTAQHNQAMVDALFYGDSLSPGAPMEVQEEFDRISRTFAQIDSQIAALNQDVEGGGLDPTQIKAAYYAMCLKDSTVTDDEVVRCFYTLETRTRTITTTDAEGNEIESEDEYTVVVPKSLNASYFSLAAYLDHEITADDLGNIQAIYYQVSGRSGEDYDGDFLRGSGSGTAIDISGFADPATKSAHDLAAYAVQAWESGWGYVWGTFGNVLTDSLLDYKVEQYPDGVGDHEDFIRTHWLGGRTTDCIGLIKGYGWLDADTLTIIYGTNGMPDIGANSMYHNAAVTGTIDTMPDAPGLAVWMEGHIGVYIGGGEVIEASSTRRGVVKTQLAGRGWTAWLEVPYISYD